MVQKRDIYHKDQPPPLARKSRRRSPSGRPSSGNPASPILPPQTRVPFDGIHPDGEMKKRRRRRRSRKRPNENSIGKWLALGLGITLLLYLGVWSYIELKIKSPTSTSQTPQPSVPESIEPSTAELTLDVSSMINATRKGERAISSARNLMNRKQYDQAEIQLNRLMESLPNHSDVLYLQAKLDYIQKRPLESVQNLEKLLSQNPDHIDARLLIAQALHASANFQQAIDAAQWTLNGDNYVVEAQLLIADSYQKLGNLTQAISHLRKAHNLRPDDSLIANDLATAYMDARQIDRALAIYNSLMLEPDVDSVTFFNLAICYARKGNKEKILEILNKAEDRFGLRYVSAWISNPSFDEYRDLPEFSPFAEPTKRDMDTPPPQA